MKKTLLACLLCGLLLLQGCSYQRRQYTKEEFASKMDAIIEEVKDSATTEYQNRSKSYYSYYLPLSIGHRDATKSCDVLISNRTEILMSVNASAVISSEYYNSDAQYLETLIDDKAYYSKIFFTYKSDNEAIRFLVNVYESKSLYFLVVRTRYFYYIAQADVNDIFDIVRDIIQVGRTTSINESAIIKACSNKEVVDFNNQAIYSVFTQNAPENGTLKEMLVDYYESVDLSKLTEEDLEVNVIGDDDE